MLPRCCFRLSTWLALFFALSAILRTTSGQETTSASPLQEKKNAADVKELLLKEVQRSKPDYLAYVPGHYDGSTDDSHNEHFLVFDGPDDSLMAVWTQSSCRGDGLKGTGPLINRIMFSRSVDGGVTWSKPVRVAGPAGKTQPPFMASWGFPMVSKSGRIYVIFNQHQGTRGWLAMHCGTMSGCYSDDNGKTWTQPQDMPMKRSPYDDPTSDLPSEWIVWQTPMRDLKGGYFVGFSRWIHKNVAKMKVCPAFSFWESVCEFMRFPNIDDNPEPRDIKIVNLAWADKALRVPFYRDPLMTVAHEPSIVRLPDKRLFCVMRTTTGCIWYSTSSDDGDTWSNPRPLLRKDHGSSIPQPLSCCPIYQLADGRYVLLHHNNSENLTAPLKDSIGRRWPAYIALAEFRPGADQPLWFSESKELMTSNGYGIDGRKGDAKSRVNTNIGVYSSFTTQKGNNVLWHPDRKFFLVGKKITKEFLADLQVPSMTPAVDSNENRRDSRRQAESPEQRNTRLTWWQEAKFGMFIHWGLYSIPAGEWKGKTMKHPYAEHIQLTERIPVKEYEKLAPQFNPLRFDARQWVRLAKEAGMKYIVITAKHQDGFAMFASKADAFNIVDATPFGRDPMRELANACRQEGIRLCFYYSHARDHHEPGANWNSFGNTWDFPNQTAQDFARYLEQKVKPQMRELLGNYGPVGLMWFDVPYKISAAQSRDLANLVHSVQPDCLINSRIGNDAGDYESLGDNQIAGRRLDKPWETCMTINDSWGFKKADQNWKATKTLLRNLIDIASKGGNFLLNVGPTAEGLIPQPEIDRLKEMGAWLKVNGEAIYGTQAGPFEKLAWGRCTQKQLPRGKTRLYLHVFDWPKDGRVSVPSIESTSVARAWLLADSDRAPLPLAQGNGRVLITAPGTAPDPISTVIVLDVDGSPRLGTAN